jgi:hypothetical protein
LRADEAERLVRERAAVSENVIVSVHAYDRIEERGGATLTNIDVFYILETGMVEGSPVRENDDEWKVVVVKRMPGTREAGVVTLIAQSDDTLFVKTVEWMDWLR